MAVALVSLVVGRLASVVEQQASEEINLVVGVKKEVENLSRKLNIIRRVVDDAERRKLKEKDVQGWILDLENLSYDMDDMLDEWNTGLLKMQQEGDDSAENASALKEKMSSFLFSPCFCFKNLAIRRDIAVKIKELNSRLEIVNREKDQFRFLESGQVNDQESFRPVKSTSFVRESEVYGRGLDKEVVLRMLLVEGSQERDSMNVITILGSGGIGKTTLAQVVYNDNKVDRNFFKKIWVCVSDPFDEIRVARAILEALGASSPDLQELESLLQRIKYFIRGQTFLLVMDDVWNEDERKWESLRNSLMFGSPESKILVTTRSERVARVIGTHRLHRLGELSDSDCWEIFSLTAFAGRTEKAAEKFRDVGMDIVKKCKGLPLAAKALGGMMRFRDTIEEWQNVVNSEIWELEEAAVQLFPHLYLSYNDLTPIMKRCFSYCAVFPKDSHLDVNKLIRIWMAQGFLSSNGREEDDMELKGKECFENLAMRSFFQESEKDGDQMIISCKMHDLIHTFAQFLTKDECYIAESEKLEVDIFTGSPRQVTRHLTWLHSGNATSSSPISSMENLRSFYVRNLPQEQLTANPMKSLNRARVLSLSHCKLQGILKQVGTLLHLRYLDLTDNPITELPETIGNLSNLQTLELQHCSELSSLPSSIGRLINLRHLDIQWTTSLLHLPEAIRRLANLRTLSEFVIGGGNKFEWLENLNQLRGSLRISFIEDLNKASDVADVEKAQFRNKKHIKEFILLFNGCKVTIDVVEALQPPPNVQILEIWNFSIGQFPGWVSTYVSNLRVLVIRECSNCVALPPLGRLPLLESLELIALYDLKHVGSDFLGVGDNITLQDAVITFPKLQKLVIYYCFDWISWEDLSEEEEINITVMPQLQYLELKGCSKLRTLPPRLLRKASSLENLSILYCDELENTLGRPTKNVDSKELIDQFLRGIPR